MRILVTGREGQLARSLAERAANGPHAVMLLGRPDLDLTDPEQARSAIVARAPELVINAAAYTAVDRAEDEPEAAEAVNGIAPGVVAEAAAAVGAPVIHLSTDYVFPGEGDRPLDEDRPTSPLGVYGRTKLAGEEAVRAANPRSAIVRTAWVYSPFGANFIKTMLRLANDRDVIRVVGDQVGSPTSALDLADGLLALAATWERDAAPATPRTYHLAGTGQASWAELAAHALDASARLGGPSARVEPIATHEYPTRAVRPRWSVLDSTRFAADTGYAMPPWRASVDEVVRRLLEPGA